METVTAPSPARLRTSPSIVYTFDHRLVCTMSEGSGLALLGLRPGQLVGADLAEAYADDPEAVANLRRALTGERFTVEREHQGRVLEISFQPLSTQGDDPPGGLGVVSDVTDQRRLEEAAREQERRINALVELDAALARDVVDLSLLLDTAVRAATEGTSASGALWMPGPDPQRLRIAALNSAVDESGEPVVPPRERARVEDLEIDRSMAESIPRACRLALSDAADAEALFGDAFIGTWLRETGAHSVLRIPLRARENLLGALDLVRRNEAPMFTDGDVDFSVDVAERVALALDNALLLRAQRDALEEQMKFKALADATSDLIAMTDTEHVATYVNARVADVGAGWVGRGLRDIFGSAILEDVVDDVEECLASRGRWKGDLTLIGATSPTVARTEAFQIAHPETGAPLGTVWVAEDVTELRSAERALRAANVELLRFKALVEACPEFIAIADLDGNVLYVNPPGRAMVGLPPDVDVSTTRITDYLTEEGLALSLAVEQPAVIEHGSWEGESTLRNLQGGPAIPVQIASFLMPGDPDSGEPITLATVQRDLSDRVRAERALRHLAEQRQRLLSRLVDAQDAERAHIAAEVHDDSVQALAAVDLRLGLLSRRITAEAPHLLEHVDPLRATVSEATDRLRTLLFDLSPVDLDHGLAPALRETAREIFDGSSTEVTVTDLDGEGGQTRAGDAGAGGADAAVSGLRVAHRIVKEALFNVRKHARADHVSVSVQQCGDGLDVQVVDDGVGIPDHRVTPVSGHLGLATMQNRAEIAGGQWSVERRPEGGTKVSLWLPRDPGHERVVEPVDDVSSARLAQRH